MTRFIRAVHDDLRRARLTRRGATHRAADVVTGQHKRYERMVQIALPSPSDLPLPLHEAIARRHSRRTCSDEMIPLTTWGALLGHALGVRTGDKTRNYPSGGALYPVETYLLTRDDIGGYDGAFHYNPTEHALEHLWKLPDSIEPRDLIRQSGDLSFTSLLVFTSVWQRSSAKYGDLAMLHALIEAGHMSQNILLVAESLGLQHCPLAGFEDDLISEVIDLRRDEESPIHSIALGMRATPLTYGV